MNESGRKKREGEGKKLMAQENPLHYTCFKEMISEYSAGPESGHDHART